MELLVGRVLLSDCFSMADVECPWLILTFTHVLRNGKICLVWGLLEVGALVFRGGHFVGKLYRLTQPEVVNSIRRDGVADLHAQWNQTEYLYVVPTCGDRPSIPCQGDFLLRFSAIDEFFPNPPL